MSAGTDPTDVYHNGAWYNRSGLKDAASEYNSIGAAPPVVAQKEPQGSNAQLAPVCMPVTAAGTYTGTGAALDVNLGWRPKFVIVKSESATQACWVTRHTWFGRAGHFTNTAFEGSGTPLTITTTGFSVGTAADVNTGAAVYHYFAIRDDGYECILTRDHAGNTSASRTLDYFSGYSLAAAIFKRDNTQYPSITIPSGGAVLGDGSAATSCVINSDGTITVGQGLDINVWSGSSGESCVALGIVANHPAVYVTTYTGTAATKNITTPFDEIECFLAWPRSTGTSQIGIMWTSTLTTAGHYFALGATAKVTTGASIASVTGGTITLGTIGGMNQNGKSYVLIAFRKNRAGGQTASGPTSRPLRSTKHVDLEASAYISCGTSDTLKIDGAMTMEWFGAHGETGVNGWTLGASANDETKQAPLIWRGGGADGIAGNTSWGMFAGPNYNGSTVMQSVFVAVCNFFDIPQVFGSYDLDANQPWVTGVSFPGNRLQHICVTHNGSGYWRVYVDGMLVKERNRDMLSASTPRANIASGSGHTTVINGRKRAGGTPDHTGYRMGFYMARIYSRALTSGEVWQNYNALFNDNTLSVVTGYTEEWKASGATGSSLPATVSSANNGTITGTFEIVS